MSKTSYDPSSAPAPDQSLAQPEGERLQVVQAFHLVNRLQSGNLNAHAAIHVAVENQAATGFEPTVRALQRLQQQGLDRHDAVHAIEEVLADHIHTALKSEPAMDPQELQAQLSAAIERLDRKVWLGSFSKR